MHVAVIGAGYAGLAAAAELAARNVPLTVFETSRTLGGRARRVEIAGLPLDNGQHILVGAYSELLRLMRLVGADPALRLLRRPLTLVYPGRMALRVPRLPAPLHLAAGLIGARGLPFAARVAAVRFMRRMQADGFRLAADIDVDTLLRRHGQPYAVRRFLWEPLCLSALNTPPAEASAQIFLNVLRDSLAGARAASDLLLARGDFSDLFPEPAERFIRAQGGTLLRGTAIQAIGWHPYGFNLAGDPSGRNYTHVIAAVAPYHLARLAAGLPRIAATLDTVARLEYEPILTAYLAYPTPLRLPEPMIGLGGGIAHFAFQRGDRLLAAVISARGPHLDLPREELVARIHREFEGAVGPLPGPMWWRVIVEKRATFACRPGVVRPATETPLAHFLLAGDYVAGDYPATLEAAVRSGVAAARAIS